MTFWKNCLFHLDRAYLECPPNGVSPLSRASTPFKIETRNLKYEKSETEVLSVDNRTRRAPFLPTSASNTVV